MTIRAGVLRFPLASFEGWNTLFRFFQIAPEKNEAGLSKEERDARMAKNVRSGRQAGQARQSMARHPSMHQTDTLDYIVLLKGEVTALVRHR